MHIRTLALLALALVGCGASPANDASPATEPDSGTATQALVPDSGQPPKTITPLPPVTVDPLPRAPDALPPSPACWQHTRGTCMPGYVCEVQPNGNYSCDPSVSADAGPVCTRGTGDACGWVSSATIASGALTVTLTSHAPSGGDQSNGILGTRVLGSACSDAGWLMTKAGSAATCSTTAVSGDAFYMAFEDCGHLAHIAFKADAGGVYRCSVECQPCDG